MVLLVLQNLILLMTIFKIFIPGTNGTLRGTEPLSTGLTQHQGCYMEDPSKRDYTYNTGYRHTNEDILFGECARHCTKWTDMRFVAFPSNDICLCGPTPNNTKKTTPEQCPVQCTSLADQCGGPGHVSVYAIQSPIKGLKVTGDSSLEILKEYTYTSTTTDGVKTSIRLNMGDERFNNIPTDNTISYHYLKPGKYLIRAQASRKGVKSKTASLLVEAKHATMTATALNFQFQCPPMVRTDQHFYCNVTAGISHPELEVHIDWGDTKKQSVFLGETTLCHVGELTKTLSATNPVITTSYTYPVMLMLETPFKYEGTLVGVDLRQQEEGPGSIDIQIYRPMCINGMKYCIKNPPSERCQPECRQKSNTGSISCDTGSVYDTLAQQCRNSSDGSLIPERNLKDVVGVRYHFVGERRVTPNVGVISVNRITGEPLVVQPGDIPAMLTSTSVNLSSWDGPQLTNNVAIFDGVGKTGFEQRNTDTATFYVTASDIVKTSAATPLIRFNVMRRHRLTISHQYSAKANYQVVMSPKYRLPDKTLADVPDATKEQNVTCAELEGAGRVVFTREEVKYRVVPAPPGNMKYTWNWGEGRLGDVITASAESTHRYLVSGPFSMNVSIADGDTTKQVAFFTDTIAVVEKPSGFSVSVQQWPALEFGIEDANIEFTLAQGSSMVLKAIIDDGGNQSQVETHDFGTIGNIEATANNQPFTRYVVPLQGRSLLSGEITTYNEADVPACFRRCIVEMKFRCVMFFFRSGTCSITDAPSSALQQPLNTGIHQTPEHTLFVIKEQLCGPNMASENRTRIQHVISRSGVEETNDVNITMKQDPKWCLPPSETLTGVTAEYMLITLPGPAIIYAILLAPDTSWRVTAPTDGIRTSMEGDFDDSSRPFSQSYVRGDQMLLTLGTSILGRYVRFYLGFDSQRPCLTVRVRACHGIVASHAVVFKPMTPDRLYKITAQAENEDKSFIEFANLTFHVMTKLAGLSLTVPRGIIYQSSINIPYSFTAGSSLSIVAQLNNTPCVTTKSGTISVTPNQYKTGRDLYILVFKISNLISEYIERTFNIYIDDGVIKSTIEPKVTYVKRLHPFVVTTTVSDGNKVNMTVDFRDGSPVFKTYNETRSSTKDTINTISHVYSVPNTYTVTYDYRNHVNELSDYSTVTIQNPPVNMNLTSDTPVTMRPGEPKAVNFNLTFHGVNEDLPTDVSMVVDYGDGETKTFPIEFKGSQFNFAHTYATYMTYQVTVNVSNYVGWQVIEHTVECDEAITAGDFKISHRMVEVASEVRVVAILEKGTRVTVELGWGDGDIDIDYVEKNRTEVHFNHTYTTSDNYTVNLQFKNTVSYRKLLLKDEYVVGKTVVVQHPVVGFSLRMPAINTIGVENTLHVPSMLMILSSATLATNPYITLDYGDGSKAQTKYVLCNRRRDTTTNSTAATTSTAAADTAVSENTASETAVKSSTTDTDTTGTNIPANPMETTTTTAIPLDYCYDIGGHVFTPGKYHVKAKIENLVSNETVYAEIGVYLIVAGPKIRVTYKAREEDGGTLQEGKGPRGNIFPMYPTDQTMFEATVEAGNILRYTWDFGDNEIAETESNTASHLFKRPATFTVRVTVANVISHANASKEIMIYSPVGNMAIASEVSTSANASFTFSFILDQVATKACYKIDFNTKLGIGGERYAVLGTKTDCNTFYPDVKTRFDLPADLETKNIISVTNKFIERLTAYCRFEGRNYVSHRMDTSFKLIVILGPCKQPKIEVSNKPKNVDDMKCDITLCKGKNYEKITMENSRNIRLMPICKSQECSFGGGVVGKWRVDCATDGQGVLKDCTDMFFTETERNSPDMFDMPLVMKGGSKKGWPKGYYEIKPKCCMKIEPELCSLETDYAIYYKVVATPLKTNFPPYRSVPYKTAFRFECDDPIYVRDPDEEGGHEQEGLTFRYHGQHSSNTSENFMIDVKAGELTNERATKEEEFKIDEKGCLTLNTTFFVEGELYKITMAVSKKGKQSVSVVQEVRILIGNPPRISIQFASQFYMKNDNGVEVALINIKDVSKLRSVIKGRVRGIRYEFKWDVASNWVAGKTLLDFDQNKMDPQNLTAYTPTGLEGTDLAATRVFETGRQYCLRLMVRRWSPDGRSGWGDTYSIIEGNIPPDPNPQNFSCKFNVDSGEALKTEFDVLCSGKMEGTGRMTYQFIQKTKLESGTESLIEISSEPKLRNKIKFPPGDPNNDFRMWLIVRVKDIVGSTTDINLPVKVTTPLPPPGEEAAVMELPKDELKDMTPSAQISLYMSFSLARKAVTTTDTTDSGTGNSVDNSGSSNGGSSDGSDGSGSSEVNTQQSEEQKQKEKEKAEKKKKEAQNFNKDVLAGLTAAASAAGPPSLDMVIKVSAVAAAVTEDPTTQTSDTLALSMNLALSMTSALNASDSGEDGDTSASAEGAMMVLTILANIMVGSDAIEDPVKKKEMDAKVAAATKQNGKAIENGIVINEGPTAITLGANMRMTIEKRGKEDIQNRNYSSGVMFGAFAPRQHKFENESAFSTTVNVQEVNSQSPFEDLESSSSIIIDCRDDRDEEIKPNMTEEPAKLAFKSKARPKCTTGNSSIDEDSGKIHEVEVRLGHALELTFNCKTNDTQKCGLDVYLSLGPNIPKVTEPYATLPIKDDCPCDPPTNPYILFITRENMTEMIEELPEKDRKGGKALLKFSVETWITEDLPHVLTVQVDEVNETISNPDTNGTTSNNTEVSTMLANTTATNGTTSDNTEASTMLANTTATNGTTSDNTEASTMLANTTVTNGTTSDNTEASTMLANTTATANNNTSTTVISPTTAGTMVDENNSTEPGLTNSSGATDPKKKCDVEKYGSYEVLRKTMIATQYSVCTRTINIAYKDPETGSWLNDGVRPSRCSTINTIRGYTTHLSAFISAISTPPNKITPGLGFSNLNANPICMAVSLAVIGLYLSVLIWARKADKNDKQKVGVTPLADNHPRDKYLYTITVYTGFRNNAGTTARVSFILVGDEDETKPRTFKDEKRVTLKKGSVDSYLMAVPSELGKLSHIRIWHDNSGKSPSWYFSRMLIEDIQTQEKYYFICDRWLAVEEDDGMISRVIPVAGLAELTSFQHLFWAKTSRKLTDDHIWFSILHRPARSPFTRVQRLTCCLSLLFCTMMANIMWFGTEKDVDQPGVLRIGPLAVSVRTIWVTFITTLTVFPINLIIVSLFRYRKPRETRKVQPPLQEQAYISEHELSNMSKLSDSMDSTTTSSTDFNSSGGAFIINNMDQPIIYPEKTKKTTEHPKKRFQIFPFPWWVIFPAYGLAFGSVGASFFIIVETGGTLGFYGAGQWLSAMAMGIVESIFLSQPLKIVVMALVYALIIRKPDQDDENERPDPKALGADEEWVYQDRVTNEYTAECQAGYPPPDIQQLKEAREERLKEVEMKKITKDLLYFLIFVIMLFLVTSTNKDRNLHYQNEAMMKQFFDGSYTCDSEYTASSVTKTGELWNYINDTVLPSAYGEFVVQGKEIKTRAGFVADGLGYLIGQPRLRLLRLKNDTCKVPKDVAEFFKSCRGPYSIFDEDETKFKVGWKHPNNSDPSDQPALEWSFQSALDLYGYPYMGTLGLYGGGGYVADMGTTLNDARKRLQTLFENDWIDQLTRAVFVEFVVYNGNVDAYTISQLLFEYYEGGGIVRFPRLHTMHLDQHAGNMVGLMVAAEIIIVLCMIYFMVHEIKKIWKLRKAYFTGFWNWWEVTLISLGLTTIVLFFMRFAVAQFLESYIVKNKGKFINFQYLILLDEVYSYIIGMLTFTTTMKLLKLLRFNRKMSMLGDVLRYSAWYLFNFGIVFLIMFFAYVQMAYLFFSRDVFDFKTVTSVMETLFVMLLNKFDFRAMVEAQPVLGPFFFFLYSLFVSMILINFFLTIICEAFTAVRLDKMTQSNDYEIVDYMVTKLKRIMNVESPSCRRPNPTMADYVSAPGESEDRIKECEQGLDKFMLLLDGYLKDDPLTRKMQENASRNRIQQRTSQQQPMKSRPRDIKIA